MERTLAPGSSGNPIGTATPQDVSAAIDRLIATGKCKEAVELAKIEHKSHLTAATEGLLLRAYVARIEQFYSRGMTPDAKALLARVRERFPGQRDELHRLELHSAAADGRLRELLAGLADEGAAPAARAPVEQSIRQHLIDLPGLADCDALPTEHPLRVAAGATWRALQAVTAGPVSDEQIALREVSHRSPLAGWKMLVRALAAFYRHDDDACRRALDAIPGALAVARLAEVLRAIVDGSPLRGGCAGALQMRVIADDRPLREALEGIEIAFRRTDLDRLTRSIRRAVQACATSRPEFLERLRQHVSVACMLQEVPVEHVIEAMGASHKEAYFWRLIAKASEREGAACLAALYWERFIRHAVTERMFPATSLEAAMVYLHAAELLSRYSPTELRRARDALSRRDVFAVYYKGQPAEIARLAPPSGPQLVQTVLAPGWFFERAAEIHPSPETFRRWWSWAQAVDLPDRAKEDVARRWHEKQPRDPQPLLLLSALAEQRGALKLAIKHLSAAEALDAIDPRVRQARVRLTLATTWRHFKDKKPHLVENDLAELSALPGMCQGDRAAFVAAVRAASHALRHDAAAMQQSIAHVIAQAGALVGQVILESVVDMARLPRQDLPLDAFPSARPDPREIARAEARSVALSSELGLLRVRPATWDAMINDALRQRGCPLSQAELLAIGRAAAERGAREQAYLASAAGLATAGDPAAIARFLALRAQSLVAPWAHQRSAQCLAAARELARRAHDADLLQDVSSQMDRHPAASRALALANDGQGLGDDVLAEVLKLERDADSFPRDRAEADRPLASAMKAGSVGRLPFGPFDVSEDEEEEEEEDAIDDETGDVAPLNSLESLEQLDPDVLDFLQRTIDKKGRLPNSRELMDHPELLVKLLAALGQMPDLADDSDDAPGPRGFFGRFSGRRNKHKKRRR